MVILLGGSGYMNNIENYPFSLDVIHKFWYPDYYDRAYRELGIRIVAAYNDKLSTQCNLPHIEQVERSNNIYYIDDLDYECYRMLNHAFVNTGWNIYIQYYDDTSLGDDSPDEDILGYMCHKNNDLRHIYPYTLEQIREGINSEYGNACVWITSEKIGRYMEDRRTSQLDFEIMKLIDLLHPLYCCNSNNCKLINGTYAITFSLGVVWDAMIDFTYFHPNFYSMAIVINKKIDEIYGQSK